jgi:hypothetical protein
MPTEKESKPKVNPFAPTEHLIKKLEEYLKNAPNQRMSTLAQCILFRVRDKKHGREIASLLGRSEVYVKLNHSRFRHLGFSIFETKADPFAPTEQLIKELQEHLNAAPNQQTATMVQCVLLRVRDNKIGKEIASLLGIPLTYVRLVHARFIRQGLATFVNKRGNRYRRKYLTPEEEREFLMPFVQNAQAGNLPIVRSIHSALEQYLNHTVGTPAVYNMLKRNGWYKLKPKSKRDYLGKNTSLWVPQDVQL